MNYIKIGFIKKPHGIKGELKVLPLSDGFERFKKLKKILIEKNGEYVSISIESVKCMNDEVVMKFQGVSDRDCADTYRDYYIYVEREEAAELDEWEFYTQDLIDLPVYYQEQLIGTVVDVQNFGANDNIEIKMNDGKTVYYPFHRDFLEKVDVNNKIIQISQYDGFFD
ncbi:MAG: 16S rRNA processing protein RimM [Spirochaetes bacterium GWF1_31_7]|nr:MAG: 16S rRNA processing protein RimM [Spirochaetes bacterium GWE1_32_154]OHD51039.1 MAG: 16S rRNA processing protein RimM [Spirochaetes bacterium GWF1_31_7]OHD51781.1 MAG: 16S rRNA processing protein RimM [Spirochaetes bacterium GWE2_31_10]OHD79666.1 MAG: 16S rRNA processing protein RimM [Spirochaetes bacterium RIFOXYB1_FULL_32_8]HBD94359.1 16S rRNA processing protein RimM [Spirochaetia bacterium]